MPYTLAQLEFLGAHLGVAIPPEFIEKKLQAEEAAQEAVATDASGSTEDPLRAQCESRIAALEPRVLDAQKTRAGEVEWMTLFMSAQDLAEAGKFPEASKILDRLDKALSAPPDATAQKPRVAAGTVDYAKLQLRWRAAQDQAASALAELGKALLAIPEVQADPRFSRVQKLAAGLPHLIPSFGAALADQLDAAAKGGEGAAEIRLAARATIASYLKQLASVPVLTGLESFAQRTLGADLPSATALADALNELDATLAKSA